MSTKINAALDRRTALRVGAAGAAATAVGVALASDADAAAGQAVLQGRTNTVGTPGTVLTSSGTEISLTVRNTGAGAAAFFFGQNNNGFAGGTGSGTKYGLSAANTGAAGTGAAVAASGGNNTGILANTTNSDRFALEAVNLSPLSSLGGAVLADGGEANPAVVAIASESIPSLIALGDTFVIDSYEIALTANGLVFGATSAYGPEVTFTGETQLDQSGASTITLTGAVLEDLHLADSHCFATPNSGPMPSLWMRRTAEGAAIEGGTPGGVVSWRIVTFRSDLRGWVGLPDQGKVAAALDADAVRRTAAAARALRDRT